MVFKMRILYHSKAGNTEAMANAISRDQKANSDHIPPAYPCDGEKLLFIGLETDKAKPEKQVEDFCRDLNPQRAKNVAFFAVGPSFEAVDALKETIKKNGLNVVGETYKCTVKSSLFKKGKVGDAEISGAVKWAQQIVSSLAK